MLGISQKAVESYEQGWRKIPPTVERTLYYIVFKLKSPKLSRTAVCWEARSCPRETQAICPAWIAGEGQYCWFITGKLCAAAQHAGDPKSYCYECPVFTKFLDAILNHTPERLCP